MGSVGKELKQGFLVTLLSQYSTVIVQVVLGIILARLLTPEEFGIVAVILVFVSLFQLVSGSFSSGIIQIKELNQKDFIQLFILTFFLGIILSILFCILGYCIVWFYTNEVYLELSIYLSIGVFFSAISMLPMALNRRNKLFLETGISQLLSAIISGAVGVFLAYNGYGYYTIVLQSLLNSFLVFVFNFYFSNELHCVNRYMPNNKDMKASFYKIKDYVFTNLGFDVLNFFSRNLDSILIGKFLGVSNLALYDKSYRLVLYPVANLQQVVGRVLHPVLSSYSSNLPLILSNYKKVLYHLGTIGASIMVFIYFSSTEIITIMYGEQWLDSIPIFRILSLTIWFQIIQSSTGSIFLSTNNPRLYFYSGGVGAVFIIFSTCLGIYLGDLVNVVYLVSLGLVLNFVQSLLFICYKVFNCSLYEFLKVLFLSVIGALFSTVLLKLNIVTWDNYYIKLIYNGIVSFLPLVVIYRKKIKEFL
ncbi:lipopolysaccharide biosynthesis protein [Myroides pelagicus]|uniref:Oligosaccharide flippase family protein n=1 Tax=Myroides pelagicus TaxID=270914 RepID=A0A7K1GNQ7_9FLAO|nr:lipopolysaccharide biosynthesis protein [Myroides pelagicus]MTH30380.1 oligosaccharide flippase family protein [Myroides pelagicus]